MIGGAADAIAYIRFGTFVGAMSGNTILLGIDLFQNQMASAAYHLAVIATFFAAVVLAQAAKEKHLPLAPIMLATAIMLAGSDAVNGKWSALLSAAALGLENGAVRKFGGVPVNTVFVTGDLVRLASALPQLRRAKGRTQIIIFSAAWCAYAVGAILGAAGTAWTSHPMVLPAAFALLAAVVLWRLDPAAGIVETGK
jgi:uncharacterized membrane protein YoaK (UPF0700 family)